MTNAEARPGDGAGSQKTSDPFQDTCALCGDPGPLFAGLCVGCNENAVPQEESQKSPEPVQPQPEPQQPQATIEEIAEILAQRHTLEELGALRPLSLNQEFGLKGFKGLDAIHAAQKLLRGFKGSTEELIAILRQRVAQGDLSVTQPEMVAKEFGVELSFAQLAVKFAQLRVKMANPPRAYEEPQTEPQQEQHSEPDTWQPVDLGPYLRGEIERPTPSVGLARSDGLRMLYPGKEHSIIGEMESGKSWFSLGCVKAELDAGNTVLYFHFEEADPSDTVERLQALGVKDHDIEKRFRFIAPQSQVTTGGLARLLAETPTLVVFDGVNEAMSLHGWGIREEDGAAKFRRSLVMPCIRSGAATLSCDHVVKDKESRGRNAIGSIHKGNGLSGSLILLETVDPFGRGQRGASKVFITKDRPGHLRRHGRPEKNMPGKTFLGMLAVDAAQEELELSFWAPKEDAQGEQAKEETDRAMVLAAVVALGDEGKEATVTTTTAKARMKKQTVNDILGSLYVDGVLTMIKKGNAHIYSIPTSNP